MSPVANVAIHPSQFPEHVRADLLESLRLRRVNHKFHYDSVKQAQKWLALHQAYSPSRTDVDCAATYDRAFAAAVTHIQPASAPAPVHILGLGCGGGQKDTRLIQLLRQRGHPVTYTPSDVSTAMVLVARGTALTALPDKDCFPLVCDLATAEDLPQLLNQWPAEREAGVARLITFFGMIPNFEPQAILPRLAALLRPGGSDLLLFSANLAPGPDYAAGVRQILPLYDNNLTRDWLLAFLLDLGVEPSSGALRFGIEEDPAGSGLLRVAADFAFSRASRFQVQEETFLFEAGEIIRLFYSYRHTPDRVSELLSRQGLRVREQWVTRSGEEGVFLVQRERP
jgi:uncharacterized SAM-dependent methyltransferase